MAYYLQMNGTSDKIQVPSLTFDKVIFDVVSRKASGKTGYLIDARTGTTGYLYSDTNLNELFAAFRLYVNDVQYSSGTNAIPAGTRATVRLEYPGGGTDDVALFARYTGVNFLQADVYDVKFYNGLTLVAHYDMTLGNVQDQSGNSNHATLTGGTWVNTGGTGTPGTTTFDTLQNLYTTGSRLFDTLQALYSTGQLSYDTQQTLYQAGNALFDTQQAIYYVGSVNFDTLQTIQGNSITFDTMQRFYQTDSMQVDTVQHLYLVSSQDFDTLQEILVFDQVIDTVELQGERYLLVSMSGQRELSADLNGIRELNTSLKGVKM